ncbi:EAL domain-containing protein [Kluyvera cryocrescens]|uniref:EAL domain-containing protein n=1 Tax=Kluyvera cryocrescens TaxID=580 RepID=UPI00224B5F85|nr:EAL domain-containing protein [Kluyvera cryocrescens]MCX2867735.1 EAL domain-containing protein [Kluyvera cryocrescens]WNN70363.1 EAL domain-containing protein [Kluyvera cryocrescens]
MMNTVVLKKTESLVSGVLARLRKTILEAELQHCEYVPFIQPIYRHHKLVGCEVLLRVKKSGVFHPPAKYIKKLESSRMINDVTCELLEKVKVFFTGYMHELPKEFYFSFNICAKQLSVAKIVKAVHRFNEHFKGKASIVLEIIERGTVEFDDFALDTMDELVQKGVRFAIDDFGSGSSCLKYIEHAGFTTLKIDKHLSMVCNGELVYSSVIDAVKTISMECNMQIIAEGVETHEQLALLQNKGVDCFQGYLFSKPVSMYEFCTYL